MLCFDLFRHDSQMLRLTAGEKLFSEGDAGDVMYVLVTGEASIYAGSTLLETVGQGSILGEMAVIDGSPRSATVVAEADSEFVIIDKKRFRFLVDESPHFAMDVMKVMAHRLRQCDTSLQTSLAESASRV